ncbi:MAG: diguanylate cyclase [Thiohalocapsa sp.]|nr:diguanylate cyclase [Thiohalocapsa sp.]MCF7991738.1 diguanylate cyclase [Thiohalocapsa sp.]
MKKPDAGAKLLVVDDNQSNLDILLRLLDAYDVMVAPDGLEAIEILRREAPDVILLDIVMPGMDGYEVCRQIKSHPKWRDIPILFITAKTDEASLLRAYDVGGSDYVTKPFRSRELLARVRTQVEYRRAMEKLRLMAVTDDLTKTHNRRAFFHSATRLFEQARTTGGPLAALMLDIDHFKRINDLYGHATGDEALRRFSRTVAGQLEPKHLFGRLGGEEFAVLAPHCSEAEADALGERICAAVSQIRLEPPADELDLSVSIGVSHILEGSENFDDLLRIADRRLFEAKRNGRNRVRRVSR